MLTSLASVEKYVPQKGLVICGADVFWSLLSEMWRRPHLKTGGIGEGFFSGQSILFL